MQTRMYIDNDEVGRSVTDILYADELHSAVRAQLDYAYLAERALARWYDSDPEAVLLFSKAEADIIRRLLSICGECGKRRPDDERVATQMKCGNCAYGR